jgi:hypothetical protein
MTPGQSLFICGQYPKLGPWGCETGKCHIIAPWFTLEFEATFTLSSNLDTHTYRVNAHA